jgi:hypothetical protein
MELSTKELHACGLCGQILNKDQLITVRPGNTNLREKHSTIDLLIKVSFVKKRKAIFST